MTSPMHPVLRSTSKLSAASSLDSNVVRKDSDTAHLLYGGSTGTKDPLDTFGIKAEYTTHTEALSLRVKPKMMSGTLLDMTVTDEKSGETVFVVSGKLASMHREVHVKAVNGKRLYTLKQKWASSHYTFHAVDDESSDNAIVFSAKAKSWVRNDGFDLNMTFENRLDEGEKGLMYLRTGIARDVCDIVIGDRIVASIIRGKSSLAKANPSEAYQLLVSPGADASLMLLTLISMHIQFVDWKVMGGSVILAAAGLVDKKPFNKNLVGK